MIYVCSLQINLVCILLLSHRKQQQNRRKTVVLPAIEHCLTQVSERAENCQ